MDGEFEEVLEGYLRGLRDVRDEASRADRFRDFIRRVFPDVEVGDVKGFFPELEKYVKSVGGGQVLRGKADALFGSLLLEFESFLDDEHKAEAREQLRLYVAGIWSAQSSRGVKRSRLTAVATDGVRFVVYRPRTVVSHGVVALEQVELDEVDSVDISQLDAKDVYEWLKRYIVTAAGELRPVDPDEFARDFGVGSRVFDECMELLRAGWEIASKDFSTLYEQWDSHLRIVYGSAVGSEELYMRHTYLATLAKLVVYSSYSGGALPVFRDELVRVLDGSIFRDWRIVNFIEEDLFSWVHRVDEGVRAAQRLVSALSGYDLSSVSLDVFKELYQGLVDPEARHDLGEYYTPDWLAEMIVGDVLGDDAFLSVLDPACGSGTFLAAAISYKKQRIRDLRPSDLLKHVLENVVGVDVHPLSVLISRATYLAAVGRELLENRVGDVVVPVYLSDSIRLPAETKTLYGGVKVYYVRVDDLDLYVPADVAEKPLVADAVVDAVRDYAKEVVSGVADDSGYFRSFVLSRVPALREYEDGVFEALHHTAQNLAKLVAMKRDTVWGFILKNYYKPVFLKKRKFDAIVGNPPWLSYRYVSSVDYQNFLKELVVKSYGLLSSKKVELITHMELATLFLVRCADLYLRVGGVIGFVMPRSLFTADQHHNFREGNFGVRVGLVELVDLEGVSPLFNVPACVVYGRLGEKTDYPIEGRVLRGSLSKKNLGYHQAMKSLESNVKTEFEISYVGERSFIAEVDSRRGRVSRGRSPYFEVFRQGATIVPRAAWFVDFRPHRELGLDLRMPFVVSSERAVARAKPPYRDVRLSGRVEAEFLYAVLSGSELVPFGHLEPIVAVLPIEPDESSDGYRFVMKAEARKRGFTGLEKWLAKVEKIWEEKKRRQSGEG